MRSYYLIIFLCLVLFNCSNLKTKRTNLIDYTPHNASTIIKTSNFESLKSTISNTDLLKKISKNKLYEDLENILANTSLFKPKNEVLLCFSKDKNDSIQYTLVTKFYSELFQTDSLKNYTQETLNYKDRQIVKSTLNDIPFYSTIIDSTFIASSHKSNLDALFSKNIPEHDLNQLQNVLNDNKTCSVIIRKDSSITRHFSHEKALTFNNFCDYFAFDVDASQNEITINGIAKATDSFNSIINVFKNTTPQENLTQNITPSNSDGFMSITFDSFKNFENNLMLYNRQDSTYVSSNLFNDIREVGVIYYGKEQAIVLNTIDNIATKDALLNYNSVNDTYREIPIYEFNNASLFAKTMSPFVSYNNVKLYCVIDNFFVFASSIEVLQNIIASYQNKTTLAQSKYFKDIKEHLSDESSLLIVHSPLTLKNIINKNTNSTLNYKLNSYRTSALQFVYDTNFAHLNGVLKKNKNTLLSNSVSEELNIKLDTDLLTTPQFVKNHITKQKEIVVQDINNNLYLISNKGKILWKKQLNGPVLGKINQIDIYKNGRLQLCFATPTRMYVIDRNGKDVAPFPAKFNDKITQPLAVFDYDKKKNYRLLVTQGKNLLMYDVNAKIVNGFIFKSANNTIITPPKHFRIGSKDYLSFKTNDKLYILDRTGRTRVKPKTNSSYSNQPLFLYKNQFTTTAKNGNLITINTNGSVAQQNLGLNENHYLTTTSKTLVALSENKLSIKGKTTELDFGNYTEPKIFYINDKIYVTVTDLQSHKVYLFDSQSKQLANFPVYGNSTITLDNIDKDKNLEFVTKGDNNSIILYQIN